jgi:hypothetical protein
VTEASLIMEAVGDAVREAQDRANRPLTRPATVISIDPTNSLAEVVIDGDEDISGAKVVAPIGILPGDRVLILFSPPQGAVVIGRKDGDFDDWHFVGTTEQPPFGTNWANAPGTGALNEAGTFARVAFRRKGRLIELRGRGYRPSVAANNVVYQLPQNYRPQNDLTFLQIFGRNALAADYGFVIVRAAGNVEVLNGPLSSVDGANGFASFDGIIYSTDPPPE